MEILDQVLRDLIFTFLVGSQFLVGFKRSKILKFELNSLSFWPLGVIFYGKFEGGWEIYVMCFDVWRKEMSLIVDIKSSGEEEWIWWWVTIFMVIAMSFNGENRAFRGYGGCSESNEEECIKLHVLFVFKKNWQFIDVALT